MTGRLQISLISLPLTKMSLQPLEIVHTFAAKHVRCLSQLSEEGVCVEMGGVGEQTQNASGIALSLAERGFFFFFFLRPV